MADPKTILKPLPTAQLRYQRYSETGRLYESDIVEYLQEVRQSHSRYMNRDDLEEYLERVEKKVRLEAKPHLDREKREKQAAEARRLKQQQKRQLAKIPEKKKIGNNDSILLVNKRGEVNKVSAEKSELTTTSTNDTTGKGIAKGSLNLGVAVFNKMFPTIGAYIKRFTDKYGDTKSTETYEKLSQSSVTLNQISETIAKNNEILQQILSAMQRSQQLETQQTPAVPPGPTGRTPTAPPAAGQTPPPAAGSRQTTPPATQAPPSAARPQAAPPPPATPRMAPTAATTIAGGTATTIGASSAINQQSAPRTAAGQQASQENLNETEEQIYQRLIQSYPESMRNDVGVQNDIRDEARLQFRDNQRQLRQRETVAQPQPQSQATRTSPTSRPTTQASNETEDQIFQRLIREYPRNMRDNPDVINDVRSEARMQFQSNRRGTRNRAQGQATSEVAQRQESENVFADRILNVRAREIIFKANSFDFGQQFGTAGAPGAMGNAGSAGAAGAAGSPGSSASSPPPASSGESSGSLTRPTGGPVTSGFGQRAMGNHQGMDFGVPIGSPIVSSQTGTVVEARSSPSYGNVIRIRGEDGTETLYAHLSDFAVQPGQQVQAGQQIGASGNTGRSTGPHLHFETIKDGQKVDPAPLIGASGEAPKPAGEATSQNAESPAATMTPTPASSGAQIAQASVQSEVSMMQGQQVSAELGQAPSASEGASTPTDPSVPNIDPNNPGPVEPADAAQRYARLFNMAA